ncbi:MAG: hypothetical protein QXS20_09500 [Candidatus Thorarchaeota archaeon]
MVEMIQGFYLVNQGGETLASLELGNFHADEALLGGFLSAVNTVSRMMVGSEVRELVMGRFRLVISSSGDLLVVLVCDDRSDDVHTVIGKIRNTLVQYDHRVSDDLLQEIGNILRTDSSRLGYLEDWATKMF